MQGMGANATRAGWHNGVVSLPHRTQSCRRRIAHVAKHIEPLRTTAKAGFTGELRHPRVRSEELRRHLDDLELAWGHTWRAETDTEVCLWWQTRAHGA
jgi:hypothetical protein